MDAQGPLRLTSMIGSEEKLGGWLNTVCPVCGDRAGDMTTTALANGIFRTPDDRPRDGRAS